LAHDPLEDVRAVKSDPLVAIEKAGRFAPPLPSHDLLSGIRKRWATTPQLASFSHTISPQ